MADDNITKDLCQFVVDATYEQLTSREINKLKDLVADLIGIAAGAAGVCDSSEPFLKAVVALGGQSGNSTVFTKGNKFTPQHAAMLNAAFAHSFDFDDTHAPSILHPGATAIPAALAQAELSGADGKLLLLGIAVGYEVTCRIGRALNYGGYTRGFHNTATAGIFGAVSAIAKIKGLSVIEVNNAFGLALSKAAGSMQFLDNGSWNKRLHPGFAVHDAFVVTALAEAGVLGATHPIEGKYGALHSYSATSTAKGLTDGLGSEWIFAATAMKPFPACRMTHSAIEAVAGLAKESTGKTPEHIKVELSPGCYPIVGPPDKNRIHPVTIVDGQFSMHYQVAISWIYGMEIGWRMYEEAQMKSPEVSALCDKVEVVINPSVRDLEARLTFTWADGTTTNIGQVYPKGEDEHPFSKEDVHKKFLSMVEPVYSSEVSKSILDTIEKIDDLTTADLVKLL
ncbi:2-methylcitrate dehydratase [Microdochium trichocladiopsis]|uniref:2-methylcitrate dehydratase n=1 Tax=Microdochium trichocladiopsis TaxID=1682393 RepID=A0A9P8YHX0_9PEZI|nr:2-methylcitrate dehydratase [Microdochium trichocladiopsis]KAH7040821.1 2-methylcitrate dehydratase [Microdochium trichocladiopsis]